MERKICITDIQLFESKDKLVITNNIKSIDASKFHRDKLYEILEYFNKPQFISSFLENKFNKNDYLLIIEILKKYGFLTEQTQNPILDNNITVISTEKNKIHFINGLKNIGLKMIKFIDIETDDISINKNSTVIIFLPNHPWIMNDLLKNYEKYNIKDLILANIYLNEIWYVYLSPPITACPHCLYMRLYENLPMLRYITNNQLINYNYTANELAINLLIENLKYLTSSVNTNVNPTIAGYLNTINLKTFYLNKELVIRKDTCNCLKKKINYKDLVGSHVGLIKNIGQVFLEQSDPNIVFLSTNTGKTGTMDAGAVDDNWDLCKKRTICEFVERYSWKNFNKNLISCTWNELDSNHRISLDNFNIFSENQYKRDDFKYKKIEKNQLLDWICMKRVGDFKEIYIPAEIVLGSHLKNIGNISERTTTGVATGDNIDFALKKCILEMIERDTVTRNIFLNKDIFLINDSDLKELSIYRNCINSNLIPKIFYLKNRFNIPVIMCRLVPLNTEDKIISYGYSSSLNLKDCISKSIKESLLMRINMREQINNNIFSEQLTSNLRDSKNSFFNELNILGSKKVSEIEKIINRKINIEDDIYFCDITLGDVQVAGLKVISVWSKNMINFVDKKDNLPLNLFKEESCNFNNGILIY